MTTKVEFMDFEGRESVLRRMMQRARAANLPGIAEGQATRDMGTIVADELQNQHNRVMFAMANALPSTAGGAHLDMIGESIFGLQRLAPQYASTTIADKNIVFFVTNGELGDYLSTASNGRKYIPKETLITDSRGNDYRTTSDTYVTPGSTQAFVSARAMVAGRSRNVPANSLTRHGIDSRIQVTNRYDISNGTDIESDQNYRFRIMNAHLASQGGNRIAIENSIASIGGVSQFIVNENFNGPGTVEVLLVPTGNRLPPSVRRNVEVAVQSVIPASSIVTVREPNYVEWEMNVTIVRRSSVDGASSIVRRQASQVIMNYFNTVPVGGRMDTLELTDTVKRSLSRFGIADVKITCFLLNQQATRPGVVRMGQRDLLVPAPMISEPLKVLVA